MSLKISCANIWQIYIMRTRRLEIAMPCNYRRPALGRESPLVPVAT